MLQQINLTQKCKLHPPKEVRKHHVYFNFSRTALEEQYKGGELLGNSVTPTLHRPTPASLVCLLHTLIKAVTGDVRI